MRLLIVSGSLLTVFYLQKYYLPKIHDAVPLFVSPGPSPPPPALVDLNHTDSPQESPKVVANLTKGVPLASMPSTCASLPGAEDVVVVLKTGATEVFARLPEQLITLSRCIPNLMVFSDLEQDVGDYHIEDALDEVSDEYKDNHDDFAFYRALQKAQAEHQDLSSLTSDKGWDLDKWKNIPILHKVYRKRPHAKWFVFIDADTFLSWTNLLQLLDRLNSTEPLYFGSSYVYGNTTFAQGGTGYVLSHAAVEKFEAIYDPAHVARWELETSDNCCGDVMLAVALLDAGVELTPAWPLVQSESPSTLDFSERIWCTPAVSWHHVRSFEVEALWHFEQSWMKKTGSYEQVGRSLNSWSIH